MNIQREKKSKINENSFTFSIFLKSLQMDVLKHQNFDYLVSKSKQKIHCVQIIKKKERTKFVKLVFLIVKHLIVQFRKSSFLTIDVCACK